MNVWSSWIFENAVGENCSHFTERKKTIQNSSFLCLTTLPPQNPKITLKTQQEQDWVVQSAVKITQGKCKIWIQNVKASNAIGCLSQKVLVKSN